MRREKLNSKNFQILKKPSKNFPQKIEFMHFIYNSIIKKFFVQIVKVNSDGKENNHCKKNVEYSLNTKFLAMIQGQQKLALYLLIFTNTTRRNI